jgi:DNA repair ATPase RecN
MGSLFNQQPRPYLHIEGDNYTEVEDQLKQCIELAKKYKVDLSDVIALRQTLEMKRATSAYIYNGDAFDEQMADLGIILRDSLSSIADALRIRESNETPAE